MDGVLSADRLHHGVRHDGDHTYLHERFAAANACKGLRDLSADV